MPGLYDYIDYAKKMVNAARGDDGKHKDEILDAIEGHLDDIEREANDLSGNHWIVVADDNSGFQGIANVNVTTAKTEEEALEKVEENVDRSINFGRMKVHRVSELVDRRSNVWSYYR